MAVGTREQQVRKFVDEVWNGRNDEAAADLSSERYTNPFGTGPAARTEPISRYHGAFPGPPTGRAVEERVVSIMHFEVDKVVSEWIGADKLGPFIQLGVLDDPWPN